MGSTQPYDHLGARSLLHIDISVLPGIKANFERGEILCENLHQAGIEPAQQAVAIV